MKAETKQKTAPGKLRNEEMVKVKAKAKAKPKPPVTRHRSREQEDSMKVGLWSGPIAPLESSGRQSEFGSGYGSPGRGVEAAIHFTNRVV